MPPRSGLTSAAFLFRLPRAFRNHVQDARLLEVRESTRRKMRNPATALWFVTLSAVSGMSHIIAVALRTSCGT